MRVVLLLFFLLATSIQGGFAANGIVNPLTNPDLSSKARADLESRILEWLCPRIKMTASNYIRSRLYPLSGRLTASLSSIPASTRPSPDIFPYIGRPFPWYLIRPFFFNRTKLQSWLEQLTPSQKQILDDALMVSMVAYLKTHPNVFMVSCYIENNDQNNGGGSIVVLSTINADVNDTASIQLSPSNSNQAFQAPASSVPDGTWSNNDFFFFKCLVKRFAAYLSTGYWWDTSSVTYSHGGKQIVLTQKYPFYSSD